jgi:hypothetical protein
MIPRNATTKTPPAESPSDGPNPTRRSAIGFSVTIDVEPKTASCITWAPAPSEIDMPNCSVAFALNGCLGPAPNCPGVVADRSEFSVAEEHEQWLIRVGAQPRWAERRSVNYYATCSLVKDETTNCITCNSVVLVRHHRHIDGVAISKLGRGSGQGSAPYRSSPRRFVHSRYAACYSDRCSRQTLQRLAHRHKATAH